VRTSEDPDLLKAVVDAGIALEVCPTSNVHLGVYTDFSQVPLPTLISAGATVALAADDADPPRDHTAHGKQRPTRPYRRLAFRHCGLAWH